MKKILLLPAIIFLCGLAGCSNNNNILPSTPVPTSGTFSGQFKLYHVNPATNAIRHIDSCNLNLVMETATGYKVTGDTTTLHAGSYGSYQVNSAAFEIYFGDKTFPTSANPTKVHLSGVYIYHYDGSTLEMLTYGPLDSLEYFYKFTRTGN